VNVGWNGLTEATEASLATFNRITAIEAEITDGVSEIVALNKKIEELTTQLGNDGLVLGKPVSLTTQETEPIAPEQMDSLTPQETVEVL
jgi:hypothetical protein